MAVLEENKSLKVTVKLNNGTTPSGQTKTANVSLGSLDSTRYNANDGNTKALNIVNAMAAVFSRNLYSIEKTIVNYLSEE